MNFLKNADLIEAEFGRLPAGRLRTQAVAQMNSFLIRKGKFGIRDWPRFTRAWVRRALERVSGRDGGPKTSAREASEGEAAGRPVPADVSTVL